MQSKAIIAILTILVLSLSFPFVSFFLPAEFLAADFAQLAASDFLQHADLTNYTGQALLDDLAIHLNVPIDFYRNTEIAYFAEQPQITDIMYYDLESFLSNFSYADNVVVLTYHHLLKAQENKNFHNNSSVISVESFEAQMKYLYENGYQAYPLSILEAYIDGKIRLPKKSFFITFDDGYLSNYVYAYPILKNYQYPASIFAITSMIRFQPEKFDPDTLNYISWPEIRYSTDIFSIGSHTHDFHKKDNGLGYLLTKPPADAINDMRLSKVLINSPYFAYPFGEYDKKTIYQLQYSGYRMAFTTKPGTVKPHSPKYELCRYGVYSSTSLNQFKSYFK